jgi:hypothetical protein
MPPSNPARALERRSGDDPGPIVNMALPITLSRALSHTALFIWISCLAAIVVIQLAGTTEFVPFDYFVRQDVWWLLGLGVFCVLYRYRQTVAVLTPVVRLVRAHPAATLAGLAMLLFAVAWLGTYLLHHDYNRTLDEVLARSDAQIFGRGQLFATIPEIWRPYTGPISPAMPRSRPLLAPFWFPNWPIRCCRRLP